MTTTPPSRISARPSASVRGWPKAGTSAAGRAPSRASFRPRSPTATRLSVSSPAISTRGTASPSLISSSGRSTAPSRSTTRSSAPTRRSPSPSTAAGWRSRRRATWWGRRRTCSRPGRFGRTSPTSSQRWVSSPTGASPAYSRTCERETGRGPSSGAGERSSCVTRSPDSPPSGRRTGRGGPTPPERSPTPDATRPGDTRGFREQAELASGGASGRAEFLQDETTQRLSVEGNGSDGGRGRLRLEPGLAHDHADRRLGIHQLVGEQTDQHGERGGAGGSRPDPFLPREQPLRLQDLLVLRLAGDPVCLAQDAEDPVALTSRISRGEALRHRVADLDRHQRRLVAPRGHDGVGPRGLGRRHEGTPWDESPALHLGEAAMSGDEGLSHRRRRHHHVGRLPAELLGDLVGDGLLALVLVGIAGGAAVEEEMLRGEPIPQRDQIVVDPLVDDEIAGRGRHVEHLGRRGALVAEDERPQPRPRRVGRDGGAGIPGADYGDGGETELHCAPYRRGGGAVLHGARRVRPLELDDEPSHAEALAETRALEERRLPLAEGDAVRRVGDGKDGRVTPETVPCEHGGASPRDRLAVVAELEEPPTGGAFEHVVQRKGGAAVDAGEPRSQRGHQDRVPKRCSTTSTISSMRWRKVCSLSARLRALSPMARASSR